MMGDPQSPERDAFRWFQYRTVTKIPGVFGSCFWDTLVLQACHDEPAVFHAALALSSFHRGNRIQTVSSSCIPNDREKLAFKHYGKAIQCLQPHLSTHGGGSDNLQSLRIVLITCLLFTCLEYLRGDSISGQRHLESGIKVLHEFMKLTNIDQNNDRARDHSCYTTDKSIVSLFARFQTQLGFCAYTSSVQPPKSLKRILVLPVPLKFDSLDHARWWLDYLFDQTLDLTHKSEAQATDRPNGGTDFQNMARLIRWQNDLRASLDRWNQAYGAYKSSHISNTEPISSVANYILTLYSAMQSIKVATCLESQNEMIYDSYLQDFLIIIENSIHLWKVVFSLQLSGTSFRHDPEVPPFSADIGWISPLYYTAIKCRHRRVRIQAIRLLGTVHSQEGIWSAREAVAIARFVVQVEERNFSDSMFIETLDPYTLPNEQDLVDSSLPPRLARVSNVKLLASTGNNEDGSSMLSYIRRSSRGHWDEIKTPWHIAT